MTWGVFVRTLFGISLTIQANLSTTAASQICGEGLDGWRSRGGDSGAHTFTSSEELLRGTLLRSSIHVAHNDSTADRCLLLLRCVCSFTFRFVQVAAIYAVFLGLSGATSRLAVNPSVPLSLKLCFLDVRQSSARGCASLSSF